MDKNRITLRVEESQCADGTDSYRWTSKDGRRHGNYTNTIAELREKAELVKIDQHDGIKTETRQITVNILFDMW